MRVCQRPDQLEAILKISRVFGLCSGAAALALTAAKVMVGSALLTLAPHAVGPALSEELENPVEIIAAQIRRQGYTCDKPKSAKRDRTDSKPNAQVWILNCEAASYRVELVPDLAAKVERID